MTAPPVSDAARELGIELLQPESVNEREVVERIRAAEPEAVCVCAFGALIKEPLLSAFQILNVHPSLLPRWRGAAPIERAVMNGDERTGVSIMRVTAGLDSGPVCLQGELQIEPGDTYGTLAPRLWGLGGELLVRTLDAAPPFIEQDDGAATYAEKISAEDRRLDPTRSAAELERVVRALTPHIGAWVELHGERLVVLAARARDEDDGDGKLPVLRCAEGFLVLEVVKPAGRREMSGADWLRGRRR